MSEHEKDRAWKLNCVVSGQLVVVPSTPDTRVAVLKISALEMVGGNKADANRWEARRADGEFLVGSNILRHSDLVDGDTVYVDPKPGVGA